VNDSIFILVKTFSQSVIEVKDQRKYFWSFIAEVFSKPENFLLYLSQINQYQNFFSYKHNGRKINGKIWLTNFTHICNYLNPIRFT